MKIADFKGAIQDQKKIPEVPKKENPSQGKGLVIDRIPIGSFHIIDTIDQLTNEPKEPPTIGKLDLESQEQINAHHPFNVEKVVEGVKKYILQHHPEATIELALNTHAPIIDKEKIIILVDNQLQLEKLETLKNHLSGFLMRYLNNGVLVLNFQLFDTGKTTEKKRLFTATEKLDHFMQLNPVVAELKQLFGLELE